MGNLLTTGSVLAAFFAGGVALFAPCCIVFLAPSYLAVAVKDRRWRLLPNTFVFAAGLALVLVPITLGMGLLAGAVASYHAPLYDGGALLMFALAALSLSGRMWSLPSFIAAPDTTRGDTASFFSLGVFSGIASSCCAPVLAGVMTLSVLSGVRDRWLDARAGPCIRHGLPPLRDGTGLGQGTPVQAPVDARPARPPSPGRPPRPVR